MDKEISLHFLENFILFSFAQSYSRCTRLVVMRSLHLFATSSSPTATAHSTSSVKCHSSPRAELDESAQSQGVTVKTASLPSRCQSRWHHRPHPHPQKSTSNTSAEKSTECTGKCKLTIVFLEKRKLQARIYKVPERFRKPCWHQMSKARVTTVPTLPTVASCWCSRLTADFLVYLLLSDEANVCYEFSQNKQEQRLEIQIPFAKCGKATYKEQWFRAEHPQVKMYTHIKRYRRKLQKVHEKGN